MKMKTSSTRFILSFCLLGAMLFQYNLNAQTERYVTIFYSVWANLAMESSQYGDDVYIMNDTSGYSPYPCFNWWGKPAYAAEHGDGTIKNNYLMYFNNDPTQPNDSLFDYHAELLTEAGVDFITLDLTNGTQEKIINGAIALCTRFEERMLNGDDIPLVCFWVKDEDCLSVVEDEIFDEFDGSIFFNYLGKKLLLVAQPDTSLGQGDSNQPAVPTSGLFANHTARHCWGLSGVNGQYWCFKNNSNTPPPAYYYNGSPEQMCAPVATQSTYMTTDGINAASGAYGRDSGNYFNTYIEAAKSTQPTFLFIHSWNEWTAQNFGTETTPIFVDMWGEEYSADIEPMYGGHGDTYYNLMKEKIGEFKRAGIPDWEFDSDVEGWEAENQITDFGWQTGGYIGGTIGGTDPYFKSNGNLAIDVTNSDYLTIRMKNSSSMTTGQVYFITNSDNVWNEAKHIDFTIDANSDFITYYIDMSSLSGWTGTLSQLRIDPTTGGSGTGTFQIDYIRISGVVWEFTSSVESWTAGNNISNFGWETGGYIGGTITGPDAYIFSNTNVDINITTNKYITLSLLNNSSQTAGQIYFITTSDNAWNSEKQIGFTIEANSDFTTYTIDMSSVSTWDGTLSQLRIDPCNGGSGSGSFKIDYVHISHGMYKASANTCKKLSGEEIPKEYILNQNYPNPFNPTTTISYSIPEDNYVTLKVYDLMGQEISTLISGKLNAGQYEMNFDASNLASGVYLYRLKAGSYSITKKMVLLK
ncbi:MAG: T9SS type A sorting domain-containing protein [Ignavibacteria bacterium]